MRIATLTLTGILSLAGTAVFADTAVQQVQQDNSAIHKLNTDLRNNRADMRKDRLDAADQRSDINRDAVDRSADRSREQADLAKGNVKGADYWAGQSRKESRNMAREEKDLAHSQRDIRADKGRIAKDVKVRHHDIAKRNRAASRI